MTIKEATQKWVSEFNAIPQGMIAKLMKSEPETWHEITVPAIGDRVYIYNESVYGEIIACGKKISVKLDNGKNTSVGKNDIKLVYYERLPMWGTMWSFGESLDDFWLEEQDGVKFMSDCGFRIYRSDDFGYFFGIDGAGYDFYEQHWIPLYKVRGLKWHET